MRRRRKKIIWVWVLVLLLVGCGVGGVFYFSPAPPTEVMDAARKMLTGAKEKKAELYNKKLYGEAVALYDSAMIAWKRENEKFFLCRDFRKVISFAAEARMKADLAGQRSEKDERGAKVRLEEGVVVLQERVKEFDRIYLNIPMAASIKKKQAKGKLLLNEASVALAYENYKEGEEKFQEAKKYVNEACREAKTVVESYFTDLPLWQKQLRQTLEGSKRKGDYALVVEKFPPRCRVYYKGVLKDEFRVELGKNWLGDKCREGDDATPEGVYRVTKKLAGDKTKYYKALLLDYPNAEDRERFKELKKKGIIDVSAKIGSLIEIHGGGGRGAHWTNGCVALTDQEMDKIYRYAGVGTVVTIIGAEQSWEKTMEEYGTK